MTEQNTTTKQTQISEYPIYFAGGTGYNQLRNEGVSQQITKMLGRKTISALADPTQFDPDFTMTVNGETRQVSHRQAKNLAHTADVSLSVSNFQASRAQELGSHLEQEGVEKVDAIFQSADALSGLQFAAEHPEAFNNIILAYPAGLVQPHDFTDKKAVLSVVKQEGIVRLKSKHRQAKKAEQFDDAKIGHGKGMSTIMKSVGHSKQNKLLHEMRQHENAPGVAMILGTDDIMLAPERVIASLESSDDVDVIYVVDTPHGINGRKDILADTLSLFSEIESMRHRSQDGVDFLDLTSRIKFAPGVSEERRQSILEAARLIDAKSKRF